MPIGSAVWVRYGVLWVSILEHSTDQAYLGPRSPASERVACMEHVAIRPPPLRQIPVVDDVPDIHPSSTADLPFF